MDFKELKKVDCSKYIEKKGKFNYISWPYMVEQLRIHSPRVRIEVRKNGNGMLYFKDEFGALVETYIIDVDDGTEMWCEVLPVMDFKNKSIKNPDSMDINKAIQRCKAKCISEYLGIGLYIYMGEDLPEKPEEPPKEITIGEENVAWLVGFCKRNNITTSDTKKEFQSHYKFDPYVTTEKEFVEIKKQIESEYNEA